MRAMVLEEKGQPLVFKNLPKPIPKENEILIKVEACGVCRTDLHIVEGDLKNPQLPLILGHQVVGVVAELGANSTKYKIGDRVGAFWLGSSCQQCEFCLSARENLCDQPTFTGYTHNGGFAEYCLSFEDYLVPLPKNQEAKNLAPLLCAGVIGYRAFHLASPCKKLGLFGFGSSAHILIQIANHLGCEVYVFTRPEDKKSQEFAYSLGAKWAKASDNKPPELLDAAIIFAPVGELYTKALAVIKKGGKVISAGIHMSDIPTFSYDLLWEEKVMTSVANLTRKDVVEFIKLATSIPVTTAVTTYSLEKANEALEALKNKQFDGSIVLTIGDAK